MSTFEIKEKVLCLHGDQLFEGRIMKAEKRKEINFYFIHYLGWNPKFDEWMSEDRLEKFNGRLPKKSQEQFVEKIESDVKIRLTDNLKQILIKDHENITVHKMLPVLNGQTNVAKVCQGFADRLVEIKFEKKEKVDNLIEGLLLYFDTCLGSILLYPFERNLFIETLCSSKCDLYPPVYLLRLVTKMPSLLVDQSKSVKNEFILLFNQLVIYLDSIDFVQQYDYATRAYISLSKYQ